MYGRDTNFSISVDCDIDLEDLTLGQGDDTPSGNRQQLCEI